MNDPKILNVIGDIERTIIYLVEHPNKDFSDCPWTKSEEFKKYVKVDLSLAPKIVAENLLMQSYYLQKKFYDHQS